jgi:ABC-2 type transport system permease protein
MNLNTLKATFKRNFIIQLRAYPKDFFIGNVLTALYTALSAFFMYNLLFKGSMQQSFLDYAGTSDYMSYVIIGNCMYIFVVRTCLNVSRSLITEVREGTLESLMLAPFKRVQYFTGNMLQQTISTSGEIILIILVCLPFGARFSSINPVSTLLAFVVSLFAYFSLSLILATIMLYFRDTYISQNTLFALLFLICGVTFPIQYLPGWVQYISRLIPVTSSLELIRNSAISGMGIMEQLNNFIYIILLSSVYCFAGFKLLKRVEVTALEKIYS